MSHSLMTVEIRSEHHVVLARQRARQIAALLGFEAQDQVRIATAVSEVARNALQYAGGGRARFSVETKTPAALLIEVSDRGPGIPNLRAILDGRYVSSTGMGLGLIGSRRLMDLLEVDTAPGEGTRVRLAKRLPRGAALTPDALGRLGDALASDSPQDPLLEIQQQNQELLRTLDELRTRQAEVEQLNVALEQSNVMLEAANGELAETNRGMVALYAELDDKAEDLRRASELKSRFVSYVSHEFRTPLGAVLRLSQMLLDRMDGDLTPEQEKQVSLIRRSTADLAEMVSDLLDLAKIESGKTVLRVSEFEVEDLFATLRGMFRPLVGAGGVELTFEPPRGLPPLRSDDAKLSQILRNFISNALKFTLAGEVRVLARLQADDTVVFSVRDTGIGIPPEDQERIFEEFAQVESQLQQKVTGTGLGLPLSRKLAGLLGGRVWLESAPGAGSTFFVSLPLVCPSAEEADTGAAAESPAPPADGRILIIDDDEVSRYLLRRLLGDLPFAIAEAENGADGLREARRGDVRMIFLDLVMSGLSGYEVLERLREDAGTRRIPVAVVTSQDLAEPEREQLSRHAVAVLSKLAPPEELARRVRELVGRGEPAPAAGEWANG